MKILVSWALGVTAQLSVRVNKQAGDRRSYEGLVLANQLKVMLVSDPTAAQAAVSLVVSSGSQDDPPHLKGMAHFCEHMVHMGSVGYPDEDAYYQYVTANGGKFSAATGYNSTDFGFEINPPALGKGLEIFAGLFTHPLLRPTSVAREIKIIQSEFNFRAALLAHKLQAASYTAATSTHPFAQFKIGNMKSLVTAASTRGLQLHDEVRKHHAKHYSANLMQLVVISPDPLTTLKAKVTAPFSRIPNSNRAATNAGSPFKPEHLALDIKVNPKTDERGIVFEFVLPPHGQFSASALEYLAGYLTRGDAGSFLATQKKKGALLGINAHVTDLFSSHATFQITVIPAQSLAAVDQITRDLFAYLQVFKSEGMVEPRYAEHLRLLKRKGSNLDAYGPPTMAMLLAVSLHLGCSLEDSVLSLDKQDPFDRTLITNTIGLLSPSAMRRIVYSPEIRASQRATWFDFDYTTAPIDRALVTQLNAKTVPAGIHLPPVKPLTATRKPSRPAPARLELVLRRERARLWHMGGPPNSDRSIFSLAIGDVLRTPTAAELINVKLLVALLHDKASEITGEIVYRGHMFSFKDFQTKVVIELVKDDVQSSLAQLLELLRTMAITPKEFGDAKDRTLAALSLNELKSPVAQAYALLDSAISWSVVPTGAAKAALASLDVVGFRAWLQSLLSCNRIDALLVGPVDATPIVNAITTFQIGLKPCSNLPRQPQGLTFEGENVFQTRIAAGGQDSAIAFYVDLYASHHRDQIALTLLVEMLIKASFLDQIRTKEGLGYLVEARHIERSGGGGLLFYIQSPTHPVLLEASIESFLARFVQGLAQMPESAFLAARAALLQARGTAQPGLMAIYSQHWPTILSDEFLFDQDALVNSALRTTTLQQLLAFARTSLLKSGVRRKLSVHTLLPTYPPAKLPPRTALQGCGKLLTDLQGWKAEALKAQASPTH